MQCRVIANVNPIFCLLGDFVLLLISSFEFVGMGDNMTRKEEVIEMALHAACPFR